MKLFSCPACAGIVFFENTLCVPCGRALAYHPINDAFVLVPLSGSADSTDETPAETFRACRNRVDHEVCNWAVSGADSSDYCLACQLNETIPNLTTPGAQAAWLRLERAKRHLVYTLLHLGLDVPPRGTGATSGLGFAFKQDGLDGTTVITGHADGLITINIAEADDGWRETTRTKLGEPYRTLLGHFRHESGHYYWDRLIRDGGNLEAFRATFGDESAAYLPALEQHYAQGASAGWQGRFISAYASSHPWEDWAETWAHYLHMVDTVETARAYGLALQPASAGAVAQPSLDAREMGEHSFANLLAIWMPLTLALNSFNRGLGLHDAYPFALSEPVVAKLKFIDDVVRTRRHSSAAPTPSAACGDGVSTTS